MRKRILVDGRTPVNYSMFEPVHRALEKDPRVSVYFTASEEPSHARHIFRNAGPGARIISPWRAAFMKFHAYVTSDFTWAPLPRGTCRIQMFHGVGGKYGFDAPDRSMREWHRLFFVNERRLRNFVSAGAIDADSDAIRLVGMPKTDALVNGTWQRDAVLASLGLDPSRPTLLYAPTWSPASSLNAMGIDLIPGLLDTGANVIVKLHDRSRDAAERYSGGVDWVARLRPLLDRRAGVIATGYDISPYLVAADAMITDHSSAGFEYLLLDRPIVRINRPQLIALANVHQDYVALLASASESVDTWPQAVRAAECALANRTDRGASRRAIAQDLFYKPGGATARAVRYLCEALDLAPAVATEAADRTPLAMRDTLPEEASCRP